MEHQDQSPTRLSKDEKFASKLIKVLKASFIRTIKHPTGLILFLTGLVAALLIGWVVFPMALYSKSGQPVDFSHAIHTSPDIVDGETEAEKCAFCHSLRDDGSFTGIPKLASCMECHSDPSSPLGETAEEKKFLEEYVANEKEIPWHVYNKQPDNVYFSHIPHIKNAEIDCKTCHGTHGTSDTLPVYRQNRISGYSINIEGENISGIKTNTWDRMKMTDCAGCHTKSGHQENNECFVCHK